MVSGKTVFTNNQNCIRIESTLKMELLEKSTVTKQFANYHNGEPSGDHSFIHSFIHETLTVLNVEHI